MASFDLIEASGYAYRTVWRERRYLMRLAALPLLVKFACYAGIVALGWHENFTRQALAMLPSYFADGWMLSHFVRLIFPDRAGDDEDARRSRSQAIMAGTLAFVVARFLLAGFLEMFFQGGLAHPDPAASAESAAGLAGAALVLFLLSIWAFRFLWFYIPAAAGYPLRRFAREVTGYTTSLYMLGVWLVCFVPVFVLFNMLTSALIMPYRTADGLPFMAELLAGGLVVVMDTINALLATAGIAHGMQAMIAGRKKKTPSGS